MYQTYLPFMPLAIEQLDLRPYEIVLSSSHAVAKGILTRADQLHISYTHTPIRYAWDLYQDYLVESGMDRGIKSWIARLALHYIRIWDTSAASRVDAYLANSFYVARRIHKVYRRPARVVYPPVDVGRYRPDLPREDFFVAFSRFVPYKGLSVIVETFTRMGKPLIIIGHGEGFAKMQRIAGPNIRLLGYQPYEVVADYLQRAKALIFAADEDFGIVPVEAQAAGCPVVAYGKGGVLESVTEWPNAEATGVFFYEKTPEALETAVELFETHQGSFKSEVCRRNAERFGKEHFQREFRAAMDELWGRFQRDENLENRCEGQP